MPQQTKNVLWRLLLGASLSAALALYTPSAHAQARPSGPSAHPGPEQRFASQWNLVLGAEDLLVAGYAWDANLGPEEGSVGGTDADGILYQATVRRDRRVGGVWTPMRLAADLFVLPQLSIGMAFRMEHQSYRTTQTTTEITGSEASTQVQTSDGRHRALVLSPRLGYVTSLGPGLGTWLRAGFDIGDVSSFDAPQPAGPRPMSRHGLVTGLTAEALGVVQPFGPAVIAFGPTYRFMASQTGANHLLALVVNLGVEL